MAVNCCVLPTLIDGFAGVTVIDDKAYANPLRLSICGLLLALSVKVTAPVRVPIVVGANFTVITQLAPAATVEPQLLLWAYSFALPDRLILLIVTVAVPLFVSVAVCGALVVPIVCEPKGSEDGEIVTV